jgi:hypothetical protein
MHYFCAGVVCNLRESVGPRRRTLQDSALCTDRDVGQYDVHTDRNERRPLSGHMPSAKLGIYNWPDVEAEGNDFHRLDRSIGLRHTSVVYFQTGLHIS